MSDKIIKIQKLKDLVEKFKEERDWGRHHTPKNLAISISLEAAELMEHFQWGDWKEESREEVEKELADIVIYCLSFASSNGIDVSSAVMKKLEHNAKKYPVSLFNKNRNSSEDYYRIKKEYRKNKK